MQFDFSPVWESRGYLFAGLMVTVELATLTVLGSMALGGIVGLARSYGPAWLRIPIVFYIDSMRSIPVLVVLVWGYFALPLLTGLVLPPFWAALIALIVHGAAYVAEIFRAGIVSVRPGQTRAALALGMSQAQTFRQVIMPQAIVRMLPAYGSITAIIIKETCVAGIIAVPEYLNRSQALASQSFRPMEVFIVAALVYLAVIFPTTRAIDFLYDRLSHLGRS